MSINSCLIYLGALILGTCMFIIVVSFSWIDPLMLSSMSCLYLIVRIITPYQSYNLQISLKKGKIPLKTNPKQLEEWQ